MCVPEHRHLTGGDSQEIRGPARVKQLEEGTSAAISVDLEGAIRKGATAVAALLDRSEPASSLAPAPVSASTPIHNAEVQTPFVVPGAAEQLTTGSEFRIPIQSLSNKQKASAKRHSDHEVTVTGGHTVRLSLVGDDLIFTVVRLNPRRTTTSSELISTVQRWLL